MATFTYNMELSEPGYTPPVADASQNFTAIIKQNDTLILNVEYTGGESSATSVNYINAPSGSTTINDPDPVETGSGISKTFTVTPSSSTDYYARWYFFTSNVTTSAQGSFRILILPSTIGISVQASIEQTSSALAQLSIPTGLEGYLDGSAGTLYTGDSLTTAGTDDRIYWKITLNGTDTPVDLSYFTTRSGYFYGANNGDTVSISPTINCPAGTYNIRIYHMNTTPWYNSGGTSTTGGSSTLLDSASFTVTTLVPLDTDIALTVGGDSTTPIYHTTGGATHPSVTMTGGGSNTIYWITTSSTGSTSLVSRSDVVGRTYVTSSSRTFYGPGGNLTSITDMPAVSASKDYYIWASNGVGENGVYTGDTYKISRPDTSISLFPSETTLAAASTTDVTVNVTGDSSPTQYRLYTNNIPRWVSTYNGGGASTTDFTIFYDDGGVSELPPAGSSYTYFSQARIPTTNGGTGEWVNTNDSFSISRATLNNVPVDFELGGPVTGAALNTNYFSNVITVSGMDTGASQTVNVSGTGSPVYSKNGGAFTSSAGSVTNGDTLQLRVTSSSSSSTTVTGTMTLVSGVSEDSFSVTTAAAAGSGDLTPPGAATYGLEIFGPDGTSTVLSPTKRFGNVKETINIILAPSQTKSYTVAEANGVNTYAVMILSTDTGLIQITKYASSFTATNLSQTEGSIATAAIVLVE